MVAAQRFVGRRRGGGRLGQWQRHQLRGALLAHPAIQPLGQHGRRGGAGADAVGQLLAGQVGAHQADELLLAQFAVAQEAFHHRAGEVAVAAAEGRDRADIVPHRPIRHRDAQPLLLQPDHAVVDQRFHRLFGDHAADPGIGLELRPGLALDALELAPHRELGFLHIHLTVADLGHRGVPVEVADHVADAPDGE